MEREENKCRTMTDLYTNKPQFDHSLKRCNDWNSHDRLGLFSLNTTARICMFSISVEVFIDFAWISKAIFCNFRCGFSHNFRPFWLEVNPRMLSNRILWQQRRFRHLNASYGVNDEVVNEELEKVPGNSILAVFNATL